jgi:hypothetical protein
LVALSGANPSGGVYSGIGVTGNNFDASVGSQTIDYTYTDANNCAASIQVPITVNQNPILSHTALNDLCSNDGLVALSGASPSGGVYSGIGVAGNNFDASVGSQTIDYTYIDANNCAASIQVSIVVNSAPTVSLFLSETELCSNGSTIMLSGGSPAGGAFSGTAVIGDTFDPTTAGLGEHVITYTYTDGNGCSNFAEESIIVNVCLSINENQENAIVIYPNPSHSFITLESDIPVTYELNDLNGRLIHKVSEYAKKQSVDLSELPSGVYLLTGKTNEGSIFKERIIKSN